jgi:hypothetical protein
VKEDSVDTKLRPPGGRKKNVGLIAAEICAGTTKIHARGLIEQGKKRQPETGGSDFD